MAKIAKSKKIGTKGGVRAAPKKTPGAPGAAKTGKNPFVGLTK